MKLTVNVLFSRELCFTEVAPTKIIINVPLSGFGCTEVKKKLRSGEIYIKMDSRDSKEDGPTTRKRSARQASTQGSTF